MFRYKKVAIMVGKIKPDSQQILFKTRLTKPINLGHPLVKLADEVSWNKP